ncbi:hypothetical protein WICPIJ_008972 [Wickerhamomyces pijperi]|uniref:Phosphatidylserine decarboxylase proenzyme 2 n=1 Tax=Wickerhamomyces pijperi TaxID=599730 RepID=A0A9P8PTZ7_WICPI|nr:hypothetical protein WICPIJ_008972 [Wickerhamomyces pijperi]
MRIIPKRRRDSLETSHKLTLHINLIEGKDLVLSDAKTCNMVAGVVFDGQTSRTQIVKKTASPQWNSEHKIRLKRQRVSSPIIHIAVYDKHRKYSMYLGELRLSLVDLFTKGGNTTLTKVPEKWYKLHSSTSEDYFVTGSIKASFQLVSKVDTAQSFKKWHEDYIMGKSKTVKLDDQDRYDDTGSGDESELLAEALAQEDFDDEMDDLASVLGIPTSSSLSLDDLSVSDTHTPNPTLKSSMLQTPNSAAQSSRLSQYDSTSTYSNPSDCSLSDAGSYSSKQELKSMASSTTKRTLHRTDPSGVIFFKIISAEDLPPYKRFIKKGFDMDPFVVISCGKKTFRTSWRRHTLTPVFNQSLSFEVLNYEENFDIVFNIFDKDNISFNDKVARGSVPVQEIASQKNGIWVDYNLDLALFKPELQYNPKLKFQVMFKSYKQLEQSLWSIILSEYGESFEIDQLGFLAEALDVDIDVTQFFSNANKSTDESLTIPEVVKSLQGKKIKIQTCPLCNKRKTTDIVTHVAICDTKGDRLKSFATTGLASKRWYSKVLIKFAYGKYALGRNNANILVQDRDTGFIIEEKMSLYIRLGIRLLYKGKGVESKKVRSALRSLSFKQGARYDSVHSTREIEPFIKFHALDLSDCEPTEYKTFNEFFYRKLRKGARRVEGKTDDIITSPADSRCVAFNMFPHAKEIWIKSRHFTLPKLLGLESLPSHWDNCSIAVFRLAPQDYHRFHSPVSGVVGKPRLIEGEYYTVNPMAIRSDLDVFGENVRVVIPIQTEKFGIVFVVSVGAMLVGSTVLSVKEGDHVERADELGYFKFGGSTIITIFKTGCMVFDHDLTENSKEKIETLVRVGMSVGHSSSVNELKRVRKIIKTEDEKVKIIRTITGGGADQGKSWEYYQVKHDLMGRDGFDDIYLSDEMEDEDSYNSSSSSCSSSEYESC